MKAQNGPIVEDLPQDLEHVGVTFVWRESSPVAGEVSLYSDINKTTSWVFEKMESVSGTDV